MRFCYLMTSLDEILFSYVREHVCVHLCICEGGDGWVCMHAGTCVQTRPYKCAVVD